MTADLQQRGAYLLPSGALLRAAPGAATWQEERAWRAAFAGWLLTTDGAAWAREQLEERARGAEAARAALTREWPATAPQSFASVQAEATARAAAHGEAAS